MSTKINDLKPIAYSCNGKSLTFIKPLIMAVINLTPDSFYDGGKYDTALNVLKDAEQKILDGADILDLGAASSRPNASEISEEEEWHRLKEVLPLLRKNFPEVFLSVDTYRSDIAKKSAAEGVDIINDISAGNMDEHMFETVVDLQLPYVMMHMQGTPATMQNNPIYDDVTGSILQEFKLKTEKLEQAGFHKIILDPGFGFGKTLQHNYTLLKELQRFETLPYPILAGLSRKSMINNVIGTNPVTALNGTTVLNTLALLNGASIIRVHDVAEARQVIQLMEVYKQS